MRTGYNYPIYSPDSSSYILVLPGIDVRIMGGAGYTYYEDWSSYEWEVFMYIPPNSGTSMRSYWLDTIHYAEDPL